MGGRYGTEVVMEHRLIRKFEKAGATSKSRAVSFIEAKLDEQEQCWLDYFAGVFLGKIKKTENHLYYIWIISILDSLLFRFYMFMFFNERE